MAYPTGFKFNNTITNNNVAIEDAMTVAFTAPVDPDLLAALQALIPVPPAPPVFGPAGDDHSTGLVPDPGAVVHTPPYVLGDNATWLIANGITCQVFTSTGTWNRPAGCIAIRATIIGGGGGGGGIQLPTGQFCGGGGGGAGGIGVTILDVHNINSLPVTIGAGGAGGDGTVTNGPGGTGGTTQLGTSGAQGQATGGTGGIGRSSGEGSSSLNAGGNGGVASNCTINAAGACGAFGMSFTTTNGQISGFGGSTLYGGGGASVRPSGSSTGLAGIDGNGFGAGGSGGATTNNATNRLGGDGAPGAIIIEEFYA